MTENQKWFDLYDYEKNEIVINKIFKRFGLNNYHAIWNGYTTSIILEYNLKVYKLEVRDDLMCINIYRRDVRSRGQKRSKEYFNFKKSIKTDCWYNACKYIIQDSNFKKIK